MQCVIRGNNNLPGQNNNLSDQRGAIMTEESYKLAKAERTETAKRVKALSGKVNRYLANEIILPEDVSYSTLLLEMDELWAKFQVDHAELSVILTAMEAYQVGSSVRYQTVNQKNMVEYFTDVKDHAAGTQFKLKTAITQQKKEMAEQAEAEKIRKNKMLISQAEAQTKKHMRLVRAGFIELGVDTEKLEELKTREVARLRDIQKRVVMLSGYLDTLNVDIERLKELDTSTIQELIDQAEDMLDTTVDKLAQIERVLIVLLPEREERPPFTRDRISYSPERKIFTPKTTLAPGLQAQVRDNLRLTEEGSQEGSLPEEHFGRDINGPPTLGHPKMYKFQAIQFPTFNGMRRDWPAFRSAWKYTVEPQGYSPFYLR